MGHYTEFEFSASIKAPPDIQDVLERMVQGDETWHPTIKHEFFDCGRWRTMCAGGEFSRTTPEMVGITIRAYFKNHDGEIQKFLDFINPFIYYTNGWHGHQKYMDSNNPTLIYRVNGEIVLHTPEVLEEDGLE